MTYGPCHIAVNGKEAVEAAQGALERGESYDLICLDIMMPVMDGQEALTRIRQMEAAAGADTGPPSKIIMTTALADRENIMKAVQNHCDDFLVKPIQKERLIEKLRKLKLVN